MTTLFDSDKPVQFDMPFIDEDHHIDWQSRMIIVGQEYGFQPTTREELNRFTVLAATLDTPRATIGHLNEVLKHQQSHGADPQAAVISVVESFGLYAIDADSRNRHLSDLRSELKEVNPGIKMEQTDSGSHSGLMDVLQFRDIVWSRQVGNAEALKGGVKKRHGKKVLATGYDHTVFDDIHLSIVTEKILQMKVQDVRELAHQGESSHRLRERFWIQRLVESQKHGAAQKAAKLILSTLT